MGLKDGKLAKHTYTLAGLNFTRNQFDARAAVMQVGVSAPRQAIQPSDLERLIAMPRNPHLQHTLIGFEIHPHLVSGLEASPSAASLVQEAGPIRRRLQRRGNAKDA